MITQTERLTLRPLSVEDHAAIAQLQSQPEMMRYLDDGHVYGKGESRTWLEWHAAMWELEGYGFWAVLPRGQDRVIGWLGITKVWAPPSVMPSVEIGWSIDQAYWGQGFATEGARQALRFGFEDLQLTRIIARYDVRNIASGRVMEKIGMTQWRDMPAATHPTVTLRLFEMSSIQYFESQ